MDMCRLILLHSRNCVYLQLCLVLAVLRGGVIVAREIPREIPHEILCGVHCGGGGGGGWGCLFSKIAKLYIFEVTKLYILWDSVGDWSKFNLRETSQPLQRR